MVKYQATMTTATIVLEIEIPFKCNFKEFERIYLERYKNRITHDFIRKGLGLPADTWIKLNGTFPRWLDLLDTDNNLYRHRFRIQTALWRNNETGKEEYASIFPCFIKKYCRPCLHMLEDLCSRVGKDEDILNNISDPEELLSCEDRIARVMKKLEKTCVNHPALLNSRYTMIYARPISIFVLPAEMKHPRRFPILHNMVAIARGFFGKLNGVLAMANILTKL
jgi:hypothetical protein